MLGRGAGLPLDEREGRATPLRIERDRAAGSVRPVKRSWSFGYRGQCRTDGPMILGAAFCVGALCVAAVGCKGSAGAETPAAKTRDTEVTHQACELDSAAAERFDVNADGSSDLTIVRAGGRETCRASDLNFDGRVDVWAYTDAGGRPARRESDFDWDGHIDEIAIYRNGQLVEVRRSMQVPGRIDTWHYYEGGVRTRSERDSNGDAIVDQWWTHNAARPECPVVQSDTTGTGVPTEGATVNLCGDQTELDATPENQAKQHTFQQTGVSAASKTDGKTPQAGEPAKDSGNGAEK